MAGATGGVGQLVTAKLLEVGLPLATQSDRTSVKHHICAASPSVPGTVPVPTAPVNNRMLILLAAVDWRQQWLSSSLACMQREYRVRALVRNVEKAAEVLGEQSGLQVSM